MNQNSCGTTICSGEEVAFLHAVAGGSYEFLVDGIVVRPRADSNVYSCFIKQSSIRVFDQNTAAAPAGCSAESA